MKDNYADHETQLIGGHRFYLGTDRTEAERRATALQLLLRDNEIASGQCGWCRLGLSLARLVASGDREVVWPPNEDDATPKDYTMFLDSLQRMFPSLSFIPSDPKMYEAGAEHRRMAPAWETKSPTRKRRIRVNSITKGNCIELLDHLPDESVNLMLSSPPYAEQRLGKYPGVSEKNYPDWVVAWMSKLWSKLTSDGSVLIVVDPHVKRGRVADYVIRTQLALQEAGWYPHQTNIWFKPDRKPLGRKDWPRHVYEPILWYSKSARPFCAPKALGRNSVYRVTPSRHGDYDVKTPEFRNAITRITDVHNVAVGTTSKGLDHPAMFPQPLAERLISVFCPENGTVLDCFCGSGTTPMAAKALGRSYYGFELMKQYCEIARNRLK